MNDVKFEKLLLYVQMLNLNYIMSENHRLALLSDEKYAEYLRKQYELINQLERGNQEASE
jgi:hypothetical protein